MDRYGTLCFVYLFFLSSSSILAQNSVSYTCPSDWERIGISCVRVFGTQANKVQTWETAQTMCKGNGGYLARIDDHLTNHELGEYARRKGAQMFWIGMNRKEVSNTDTDKVEWENNMDGTVYEGIWNIKSPDIQNGDCVYVKYMMGHGYVMQFEKCKSKMAFICQRPSCLSGSFFCHNGNCVSSKLMCDNYDDCGDYSDEINCEINCRRRIQMSSGIITSPSSGGNGNYDNSKVCVWTIIGPEGSNVFINFTRFNTEYRRDMVNILIGGETEAESTSIAQLSGQPDLNTLHFRSYNNFMIVTFSTDSAVTMPGFSATFQSFDEAYPPVNNLQATNNPQEFLPQFYYLSSQSVYLGGKDYVWIITATEARKLVTIERLAVDLYNEDTIEIHDGNSPQGRLLAEYNYQNNDNYKPTTTITKPQTGPRFVVSTKYQMYIIMRTRKTMTGKGFRFSYKQGCDMSMSGEVGEIFSPGYLYGINYANYANCSWAISITGQKKATIFFDNDMDFEANVDYLKIYKDSINASGTPVHSGNGFTPSTLKAEPDISSDNGKFFLAFETNSIVNKKGFHAVYSIDCPDPGFNANTLVSGPTTWHYKDKITVTCSTGYFFSNYKLSQLSVNMECLFGGRWNVPRIPKCEPVYCGLPPVINNAFPNSNGLTLTFNNYVTYQCFPGYTMTGNANITCQSSRTWTSPPSCSIASCSMPPTILNGQRTIEEGNGMDYSSVVSYKCDDGYHLIGAPISICQSDGKYSNPKPTCQKLKCPLPTIEHADLSETTIREFGDVVTVTCKTGYQLDGGSTITCLANRTFSVLPSCIDRNECTGNHGCQGSCHNNEGSYTCSCPSGYFLNADKRTCGDINECLTNNGKGECYQKCNNEPGGYTCSCDQSGFVLYENNGTSNIYQNVYETGLKDGDVLRYNHTCVRNICPSSFVKNYANTVKLTRQQTYYTEDVLHYICNLGYKSNDRLSSLCSSSGTWSDLTSTPISDTACPVAKCPVGSLAGLTNPPTVSPTTEVDYGDYVNITCAVRGRNPEVFTKQKRCLYDIATGQYKLSGAEYECGVISCGDPGMEPGANYNKPSSFVFDSQFQFNCSNLYNIEGNSSKGDKTVRCEADGNWDFGDLNCVGATCTDPGYPAGGEMVATSFEENSIVTFKCHRSGFALSRPGTRKCILNNFGNALIWNDTVLPTCVDVENPVLSGLKCGTANVVMPYTVLRLTNTITQPLVSDNSGKIMSMTISPVNANTSLAVSQDIIVNYTAIDYAGNEGICSIGITIKDIEPPKAVCPTSQIVSLSTASDTQIVQVISEAAIIAQSSDNVQVTSASRSTSDFTVNANSIGVYPVRLTVSDAANNVDQCDYQVVVKAAECSPLSLADPLHGSKNCTRTSTGYICEISCDTNYTIFETGQNTKLLTCTDGSAWSERIPACTKADKFAEYSQRYEVFYSAGTNTIIDENCLDTYKNYINSLIMNSESFLDKKCESQISVDPITKIPPGQINYEFQNVSATENRLKVSYTIIIGPNGLPIKTYTDCGKFVAISVEYNFLSLMDIPAQSLTCGKITGTWTKPADFETSPQHQGFSCDVTQKKTAISNLEYCLDCPEGMYSSGAESCSLCDFKYFKNTTGPSPCVSCPLGRSGWYPGSVTLSGCRETCSSGMYSANGLPPCNQCPRNSYKLNDTYCESCPTDTITIRTGANSINECYGKCPQGTFNYNGYQPSCITCPANYYQDLEGQTGCKECEDSKFSPEGSISADNCTDAYAEKCVASYCFNGGTCTIEKHVEYCICPSGYWGPRCINQVYFCASQPCYNNGSCSEVIGGYNCTCKTGTTGDRCQTDIDNECSSSTCKNGGMCVNQVNSFKCLCKPGFSGPTCQQKTDICSTNPCTVDQGTCLNIGNVRRKCVCFSGYTGKDCEHNIDDCAQNPCYHGGKCTDLLNDYSCNCPQTYTGKNCESRISPCSRGLCQNGTCVDDYTQDVHLCLCNKGHHYVGRPNSQYGQFSLKRGKKAAPTTTGLNASQSILKAKDCIDHFKNNMQAGSKIFHNPSTGECTLVPPAAGNFAEVTDLAYNLYIYELEKHEENFWTPWYSMDVASSNTGYSDNEKRTRLADEFGISVCNGTVPLTTECRQFNSKLPPNISQNFTVKCGINGLECSGEVGNPCSDYEVRYKCAVYNVYPGGTCQLTDNCASSPCKNNGYCQNDIGNFRCLCSNTGYEGSLCQHNIDNCANNQCSNNSTCVDGVRTYTCSCKPGYTDQYCKTDINDCVGVNCNNGYCVDGVDSYSCVCSPGYTGADCKTDINECASEPCMHGGICETNSVNTYSCKCPNGYTGKNCETIINNCAASTCTTGTCVSLFGDFFCKCPLLTYGTTCQNSPDLCSDLNVCLNQGQCKPQVGQQPTCQCSGLYDGNGCEQTVDHCADSDRCKNGGTCVTLPTTGYRCECPDGYDGVNCENNINDCANKNCVGGTCIDMLNSYYCRCPVNKTGENCNRAVDSNYDLFFYSPERIGYATLPYPVYIDTTQLSVSIWVKFYKKDSDGTFLTIFKAQNSNRLEESEPLFAVSRSGLTVYHENIEYKIAYNFTQPNDGKWHNVVIRWNTAKGWELVLDYVVQSSVLSPYQSKMTTYLWVTLGSKYNFHTMIPIKDQGFHGYLSQFNMYNRRLENSETIDISQNPRNVFADLIAGWTDFILHRGVQTVYPSTASRNECPSSSVCTVTDREAPIVTMCPANQYKLTSQRLTSITWKDPVYEGATQVTSTHDSGDPYTLGRHIVTYEYRDFQQNTAFCHFTIYVNNYNCTNYKGPHNGNADCESSNYPYQGCKLSCPPNKKIDRYTPNIVTCGPTGNFYALDRNRKMVFPPCGDVKGTPKKRFVLVLTYPRITPTNCQGIKDAFNVLLRNAVKKIDQEWSRNMCSSVDCSDIIISVICGTGSNNGRKKRDAHLTTVNIAIPSTEAEWTSTATGVKLPGSDVLTKYALEDLIFNNENIPDAILDPNGFTVNAEDTCADGQTVIDGSCVLCGPGTFFNRTTKICDFCQIGEYQPADGTFDCTKCSAGKTTETIGTALVTDCKDICTVGSYFNTAADRCEPCPIGYHQSKEGQFFCNPCPNGQTTRDTGSNSSAACYDFCPSGKELAPNGSCLPCPVGKYRTAGVQLLCEACPTNLTTNGTGSTQVGDCDIIACPAGYKRIGRDQCDPCPIGEYQPEKWQTFCKSCGGSRYRTDQKGSTSESQCKYFCPSGYEANNNSCKICPLGLYKDNNEDPYGLCKPCGNNLRTNTTGATSSADCIIFICERGEKPNATNDGCIKCPYGTYQPLKEQTDCITCPGPMNSTKQTGSVALTQCTNYCPAGEEKLESGACSPCPIGKYKGNTDYKFNVCTKCPDNYVTENNRSTSLSDCSVGDCPAGTKRYDNDTGCEDCPRGFYQILPYQKECVQCPGNTYTRNTKSTKAEDCEVYCNSGEEVLDGKCVKCAVGYYKDNSIDFFHTCTMCDPLFVTSGNGSTSVNDCSLANCTAGYERNDTLTGCIKCKKGYYQNEKWQNDCIQCPPQKTTENEASTDVSQCILNCDPGFEDVGGACQKCKRGFYKIEKKAAACTQCPLDKTTPGEGSVALSDCSQPYCKPGTYLDVASNKCKICPYDQYQNDKWMESCINCTNGKVTLTEGASSEDMCVLDCASGTDYNSTAATCKICPQGYYRDKNDRTQPTCQICSNGKTTAGERSTSEAACTVTNCTVAGEFRNATSNTCQKCPIGTFNSIKWKDECTQCSSEFTTQFEGSATVSDCKRDCPSGYEVDARDVCQRCAKGYYRDKTTSWKCLQCQDGLTTKDDTAASVAMCTESPCVPGQKFMIGEKKCQPCPLGEYQPEAAQFACIKCPDGKYTVNNGTVRLADCLSYCDTRHNCHEDAVCADDVNTGYKCSCKSDYDGNGTYCAHKCDRGYCVNGDCIRYPAVTCACPTGFEGVRCETKRNAEAMSQQINRTIIIGSVSAGAIIMIIIALVVCCIISQKRQKDKMRKPVVSEYNGYPDKASLYTRMSTLPRDNFTHGMAPMGEIGMYDNPGYQSSRDPAVYEA